MNKLLSALRAALSWLQGTLMDGDKPSFGRTHALLYIYGGAVLAVASGALRIHRGETPEFELIYLATTGSALYAGGKALSRNDFSKDENAS